MRWFVFIPLAYLAIVVQTSLVYAARLPVGGSLVLGFDLPAAVAVAVALRVRSGSEAMLAAWVLGLLVDLTALNAPLGMYALGFAVGAAAVYRLRDAVFGENPMTQIVLGFLLAAAAHGWAALFAGLYAHGHQGRLGGNLAQALLVAACTAAATPLVCRALRPLDRLLMVQPARRR